MKEGLGEEGGIEVSFAQFLCAFAEMKWNRMTRRKRVMPIRLENMASCTSEIMMKARIFKRSM